MSITLIRFFLFVGFFIFLNRILLQIFHKNAQAIQNVLNFSKNYGATKLLTPFIESIGMFP